MTGSAPEGLTFRPSHASQNPLPPLKQSSDKVTTNPNSKQALKLSMAPYCPLEKGTYRDLSGLNDSVTMWDQLSFLTTPPPLLWTVPHSQAPLLVPFF